MSNFSLRLLSRRLWKTRKFSFLNILGLAVGIGAALAIFLVIRYETGFDRFNRNTPRIYRITTSLKSTNGTIDYEGCTPLPLPAAMHREFPQLQEVASLWKLQQAKFVVPSKPGLPDKKFMERTGTFYTEPSLFRIFDLPWLAGNPAEALRNPNTAALARSVAESWFGSWQEAMGKTILMGDIKRPFLITGIIQDPPPNTDIPLRIMLSYATFVNAKEKPFDDWGYFNSDAECFVLLAKGQDIHTLESGLPAFQTRHFNEAVGYMPNSVAVYFQPLEEMHFDERFETYTKKGVPRKECRALGLIGVFLVLVACINFINMSTAQSVPRSREIGVRKVLGGSRSRLLLQFLSETAAVVLLALLSACVFVDLGLPFLNTLLDKQLSLRWLDPTLMLSLLGVWIGVTFLAGFYPGMVLSSFAPITAIRNAFQTPKSGGISLRRGLVVIQFTIAQLLLVGTLVVAKQMNFFRNQPMGFDPKAIAIIDIQGNPENRGKLATLKARILQVPGVQQASLCGDPPSRDGSWDTGFSFDTDPSLQSFPLSTCYGDTDYLRTFHLKLLAGRYPVASDTMHELVVNEATVRKLGVKTPEDILNKTIRFGNDPGDTRYPVVGVLADFNSKPLREKIAPLMLTPNLYAYQKIAVRLDPHRLDATLSRVRAAYAEIFPDRIFDYDWFDDSIIAFYKGEALVAVLFKIFAAIAILISCLGLYGLVSLMAIQKTKEVGIRKVLGASVASIAYLFSKEFTWLIGISFLIAAPMGFYFMSNWLSGFYYRTDIGWGIFAGTLLSSVGIAWLSVGYRAAKAASANPVRSLRSE